MKPAGCWPTAPPAMAALGAGADERQFDSGTPAARAGRAAGLLGGRRRAAPACSSPPISTSTASPRPPTSSIRKAASCAPARPREESAATLDSKEGQVTVANELPGAGAKSAPAARRHRDQSKKSEEIVNYEISRTTKTEVIEGGRVNRLSVAVLVDGTYTKNDKGEIDLPAARPRKRSTASRRWCARRSASTRSRGDQVEVVNLRFAETPADPDRRN